MFFKYFLSFHKSPFHFVYCFLCCVKLLVWSNQMPVYVSMEKKNFEHSLKFKKFKGGQRCLFGKEDQDQENEAFSTYGKYIQSYKGFQKNRCGQYRYPWKKFSSGQESLLQSREISWIKRHLRKFILAPTLEIEYWRKD